MHDALQSNRNNYIFMNNQTDKHTKTFTGVVISDSMDKTIVVRVDRQFAHPLYGKRMTTSKKYKVHDEANKYHEGETVTFVETRPFSKDKRWIVLDK